MHARKNFSKNFSRKAFVVLGVLSLLTTATATAEPSAATKTGFMDWLLSFFSTAKSGDVTFALHETDKEDPRAPDPLTSVSDFKKPMMLVLWSIGCEPCLRELIVLNRMVPLLREKGADVVPVLMGRNWGGVVAFLTHMSRRGGEASGQDRTWSSTFPNLGPYYDVKGEVATRFDVRSVPRVILLNAKGQVVGDHEGFKQWDDPEAMQELEESLGIQLTDDDPKDAPKDTPKDTPKADSPMPEAGATS